MPHLWVGLLAVLTVCACGGSTRPLIQKLTPLSGSTNQDILLTPTLIGGERAQIDANDRRVVLYDVTAGARKTVPGQIEVLGPRLTYRPAEPLAAQHDFVLVVERGALTGKDLDDVDLSESPEEPIQWPFRWGFSTSPRPQVRAAYFDRGQGYGRVTVRFSQPMDPVGTGPEIQVVDFQGKPVPAAQPVWSDTGTALLDLSQALDPTQPYRLQVSPRAVAENGARLNSDGDPNGGEPDDAFSAAFSGSQPVILSRQVHPE